ncbi:MAG: hypothetical protein AB1898_32290, partial [Acidobacteriota bacterium]
MESAGIAHSLFGIRALGLVIERLALQAQTTASLHAQLHRLVQTRIQQSGIAIFPEQEAIDKGLPYLYVNVNIIKTYVGLYVFATRVSLKQPVILLRQPFDRLYTSTWETGGVGTVGLNNLS